MPTFEQIKTEYAYGSYKGVDYGARIRIIMRSPTALIYVALGVHLDCDRSDPHYTRLVHLCPKSGDISELKIQQKIDEVFGAGAGAEAHRAIKTRGLGTIIVDGGGEVLSLPSAVRRDHHQAKREAEAANEELALEDLNKCCQCGSDLKPSMDVHWLNPDTTENSPQTLADCQLMTNQRVVRTRAFQHDPKWKFVETFYTWDGESYQDDLFCDDRCAAEYGRRAVMAFDPLSADNSKGRRTGYRYRDTTHHYDRVEHQRKMDESIRKSFERQTKKT